MVKDWQKDDQPGSNGDASNPQSLLETTAPSVPSFEQLQSEEQTAFRLSYDLLRYNLATLEVPAAATASAEAEQAGREFLGNSAAVNSVLTSAPGSELSSSRFGLEMRRIAEDFRASRHGSEADSIASTVDLAQLNANSFTAILERLFHSGYNVESFVTLFHFVARLLQRAYSERGEAGFRALCHELMRAFLFYLLANVIKFLASLFRTLSQEKRVAVLSFVAGLAIASAACAAVGFFVLRRAGGGGGGGK